MTATRPVPPTLAQFSAYQAAYDYFNRELFGDTLRPCLLVFREGRPVKGGVVLGHFAWDRWTNADGETVHEISLNPETLTRPLEDTFSTLAHEMAHQWQQDHGEPPRAGYHDRQWAKKMCEIGLTPSHTGQPGGKQTGQRMDHYIEAGGRFDTAFRAMPEELKLPWAAAPSPLKRKAKRKRNKLKYTCPECGCNVWGKAGLGVWCQECEAQFQMVDPPDDE